MTMYLIQFEMCKIDPTLIYAIHCMRVSDSKVINYFNVLKIAFFDRSKYYI